MGFGEKDPRTKLCFWCNPKLVETNLLESIFSWAGSTESPFLSLFEVGLKRTGPRSEPRSCDRNFVFPLNLHPCDSGSLMCFFPG